MIHHAQANEAVVVLPRLFRSAVTLWLSYFRRSLISHSTPRGTNLGLSLHTFFTR